MKPTQLLTLPSLLLAAACGPGGASDATAKADPSASAASPEVTLKPGDGWTPETLDTGIDLSHLRTSPASTGFPSRGTVAANPATVGPPAPAGPTVPAGPPGKIELLSDSETKDFGKILEGGIGSHTFKLRSSGEHPLIIQRVKPSCGCTVAEIELVGADGSRSTYQLGNEIPPDSEFELATTLKTAGRRGTMRTNVAIYCNDAAGLFKLQLQAEVQPVLEVEPTFLDFGRITSADTANGTIRVTSTVLEPFLLTLDESRVTEPLSVELVAVEPDADGRSTTWEINAKLGPNIPEGIRRYPLRLITDVPKDDDGHDHAAGAAEHAEGEVAYRELTANVQAQVSGLVVATPNFISLGLVRPGQPVERTVRIESLDEGFQLPAAPATRITSLTGGDFGFADDFSIEVKPVEGGKLLDLIVKLEGLPDDFTGSFGGMVEVEVGHPTKESLTIRFSGVSRPGIPPTSKDN